MDGQRVLLLLLIISITLLSGLGDAQGFIHAARMWDAGRIIWLEVGKSAVGFSVGIGMYWFCLRFLQDFSIISPEIQTIGWFSVTIVGVALFSGQFLQWRRIDQIVGVTVLFGIAWLLIRAAK